MAEARDRKSDVRNGNNHKVDRRSEGTETLSSTELSLTSLRPADRQVEQDFVISIDTFVLTSRLSSISWVGSSDSQGPRPLSAGTVLDWPPSS
ncbi:hypothetical protein EYF80_039219 [Liparis tanakae]|uniref:Uncharacterized protein n=1 Tax=Liparis tanakae TaxID=230148 RepID=A0A4Z2GB37_9TELE|nr:hypothetical protein EYF80_039219 [Liparis tanakae]